MSLDNNLIKELPQTFGNLPNLRILSMQHNPLENLPDFFGRLKKLESIDLYNNKLTKLPESFGDLKSLKRLRLHPSNLPNQMMAKFGGEFGYWFVYVLKNELTKLQVNKPSSAIKNVEIITFQEFLSFIGVANDPNGVTFLKEFNDMNKDAMDSVNKDLLESERLAAQERLKNKRIAARIRLNNFLQRTSYLGES